MLSSQVIVYFLDLNSWQVFMALSIRPIIPTETVPAVTRTISLVNNFTDDSSSNESEFKQKCYVIDV